MSLADDVEDMIATGPVESETVTYCPYKGLPVSRSVQVSRAILLPDFVGGAENRLIEYEVLIVNDATRGVTTIQDGKDQIQMKDTIGDVTETTFRVTSHQTLGGSHLVTVRK